MRRRTWAALAALTLLPLAACAGGATTDDEVSYTIDQPVAIDVDTDVGTADVSVRKDPASPHRVRVSTQVGAVSIEPRS
jgi:hypothetical protein